MYKLHKTNPFFQWTGQAAKRKGKKLSTILGRKKPKNRVIHEVMHVIHEKRALFCGGKSFKNEQLFCEDVINFGKKREK